MSRSARSVIPLMLSLSAIGSAEAGVAMPGSAAVLVQDRAGDRGATVALEQALGREVGLRIDRLVDPGRARRALRRLRIRDADEELPERLRRLAAELDTDWLVVGTLHDAVRRGTPRVAVSARVYSRERGELTWAGFEAAAGVDRRKALGLGVPRAPEGLIPSVVESLFATLRFAPAVEEPAGAPARRAWAVVPFESVLDAGTTVAKTMTEVARATMFEHGVRLVSPGCTGAVLRQEQDGVWGGVTGETREALQNRCGAQTILTGSIAAYESRGTDREPQPAVAFDLRVIDAATGRITWAEVSDRHGWDRQGPFRTHRDYARGALAERMMVRSARRMLRDLSTVEDRVEER